MVTTKDGKPDISRLGCFDILWLLSWWVSKASVLSFWFELRFCPVVALVLFFTLVLLSPFTYFNMISNATQINKSKQKYHGFENDRNYHFNSVIDLRHWRHLNPWSPIHVVLGQIRIFTIWAPSLNIIPVLSWIPRLTLVLWTLTVSALFQSEFAVDD